MKISIIQWLMLASWLDAYINDCSEFDDIPLKEIAYIQFTTELSDFIKEKTFTKIAKKKSQEEAIKIKLSNAQKFLLSDVLKTVQIQTEYQEHSLNIIRNNLVVQL